MHRGGCLGGRFGARVEPSMGLGCSLEEQTLRRMQCPVQNLGIRGGQGVADGG